MLKNIKINCPHNTVQIDVLRIKPTVLYDTNSVIRKHFSTNFTVQYKLSQAKLGELCPPPDIIFILKLRFEGYRCKSDIPLYVFGGSVEITFTDPLFINYVKPRNSRTSDPFSKSKFNLKSDHVNLVAPASPIECLLYLPNVRAVQYKLGPERLTRLIISNVLLRLPVNW